MKAIQIEKDAYESWAKDKLIEYASCSVPSHSVGRIHRLVFGVFIGGGFRVTRGDEILYDGGSFSTAQSEFNAAVG